MPFTSFHKNIIPEINLFMHRFILPKSLKNPKKNDIINDIIFKIEPMLSSLLQAAMLSTLTACARMSGYTKYCLEFAMQKKNWEYRNKGLKSEEITDFSKKFNIPPAVAVILLNRGIKTERQVMSYLKKGLDGVHNPFLLNDMQKAVDRILKSVSAHEKITVYGDYDADGVTSTAILYKFLRSIGANAEYYIPDRISEGYGLNIKAINRLAKNGTKLMITVDCGITSVGEVEFAKTQGISVIITDHHTCKEELPRAEAVINPKRPDSTYPFDGLAGVGVAFKLILALAVQLGMNSKEIFTQYADLAAIGTIADVVPLIDENRIIADKGIKAITETKNAGIKALFAVAGADGKPITSTSVAFSITPRINAAGRLGSAKTAVELLTEEDCEKAYETARILDELNCKRRMMEQDILSEAMEQIASFESEQYVYVLSHDGWHHGVIGIVASRICDRFYRPCILISSEDGKGKGSGRSIEEMNLFDALTECDDILTAFGGHSQAAGLSVRTDKISEFRNAINLYAKKQFENKQLIPKIKIDCNLNPSSITLGAAKTIAKLEPFGSGNENPVFSAEGMKIVSVSQMGADGKHLRLCVSYGDYTFNCAGFGMGELCEKLSVGQTVDIAFTMNVNVYRDEENLQLLLKDIR